MSSSQWVSNLISIHALGAYSVVFIRLTGRSLVTVMDVMHYFGMLYFGFFFSALECDDVLAEAINCATPLSDDREAEAYGCEQPPSKKSKKSTIQEIALPLR